METKRNSGLDLMRLICMFMVISLHYFGEGGVLNSADTSKINALIGSIIVVLCRGAVNCFYLNSGYFLKSNDDSIIFPESFNGAFKLYKQVWTYSIIVFIIAALADVSSFSVGALFRSVFPIIGNQYWFATVFILIVLLRPFGAKAAARMNNNELKTLVIILLSFDAFQASLGINVFAEQGNGFLHATTMVIIGYALQRRAIPVLNRKWSVVIYVVACIVLRVSGLIVNRIPGCPISYWSNLMVYNSPFVILIAYAVFSFFVNTTCKTSVFSNASGSVFAAYLIQDHSMMRENFWIKVIHCKDYYSRNSMFIHYAVSVIVIMLFSICIDMLMKKTLCLISIKRNINLYNFFLHFKYKHGA